MEVVAIDQISPDQVVLFTLGFVVINATLLYTWLIMGILVIGSILVTGNLSTERSAAKISAPAWVRNPPEIFILTFIMRMSCSA
jgi:hypothetical protein